MTTEKLKQTLDAHAKWLREEDGGIRANLRNAKLTGAKLTGANLSEADLSEADLSEADLSCANLRYADLRRTNLSEANLRNANLRNAKLTGAKLTGANLSEADLSEANLRNANLRNAKLTGANLSEAIDIQCVLAQNSILPETGPVWGWKKCEKDVLVKIVVGDTARRSHATGRKCRAEHVKVLEVIGAAVGISRYDNSVQYRVGEVVHCKEWDENRWEECSGGIHFFLTRIEAERY
jgi:hypothetical protein